MGERFWLTDDQFARIAPILPNDTRGKGRVDDRRVISGIVQVLKSGGRWVDAPADYGPRKTLYNRYVRWARKGVWVRLFGALALPDGPPMLAWLYPQPGKARRTAPDLDMGEKSGRRTRAKAAGRRRPTR